MKQCDIMQRCTQKNSGRLFEWTYKALCRERKVKPLPAIQTYLQRNCLRFCADYVNPNDWSPIFNAIMQDRSLSKISVYSRCHNKRMKTKINAEEKHVKLRECAREDRQQSGLYANFLLRWFTYSLAICLRSSLMITSLALDGIPLAPKHLKILSDGLANNRNLRSLSLVRCRIGNTGCDLLLESLQYNSNLRILNLSSCCLTNRSAACLSLFLERRRTDLMQNTRKESTSSRDDEGGLRVLILDNNHKFSDSGLRQLMHTLKNDSLLKALCLRRCGITKQGGQLVLGLLQTNCVLTKIDLRENEVSADVLQAIHKILKMKKGKKRRIFTQKKLLRHKRIFTKDVISQKTCSQPISKNNKFLKDQAHLKSKILHDCIFHTARSAHVRKTKKRNNRICRPHNVKYTIVKKDRIKRTDVDELKKRLSLTIEENRNLITTLENNYDCLTIERNRRLTAEETYHKIQSKLENLRNKMVMQNSIHLNVHYENQVYTNFQKIFNKLGVSINEQDSRMNERNPEVKINKNVINSTIHKTQPYKSEIVHLSHRRPNCPK